MNILVTGSSGNLGKATVDKFIAEGHHVIATASLGKKPANMHASMSVYEADLTDETSARDTIRKIIADHQRIDVAVLTVGSYAQGTIENTGSDALARMITLNFHTTYFMARPVFLHMLEHGEGRIHLIGARPGLELAEGIHSVGYALSKSLIFRLAEIFNAQARGKNVVTSVVVPGTIDTPANRLANPDRDYSDWVSADEIADTLYYMSSPDSRSLREPVLKMYANS